MREVSVAHQILFCIVASTVVYWLTAFVGERFLSIIARLHGGRMPGGAEKSCILSLVRSVALLVLYGGVFFY